MSLSHVSPTIFQLLPLLIPGPTKTPGNELWETLAKRDPDFLGELRRDHLTPLLYAEIVRQNRQDLIDPEFLQVLRHDFLCSVQIAAQQERDAFRVIQSLSAAGIDLILLKGADLRLRVYGDPAARPMSDLDLLIHKDQVSLAKTVLTRMDYLCLAVDLGPRPKYWGGFSHELTFMPPQSERLIVQPHWEIRAVSTFYRLPYSLLSQRAIPWDFNGIPVKLLAPEHAVIHQCLHAFSHLHDDILPFYKTQHIIDISLALQKLSLDWSQLLDDAAVLRTKAPLYQVIREISRLLPHVIPLSVLSSLSDYHPRVVERIALNWRLKGVTKAFALLNHHSPGEWLLFLFSNLWPDPAYLVSQFGKPDRAKYLWQLLKKFFSLPS